MGNGIFRRIAPNIALLLLPLRAKNPITLGNLGKVGYDECRSLGLQPKLLFTQSGCLLVLFLCLALLGAPGLCLYTARFLVNSLVLSELIFFILGWMLYLVFLQPLACSCLFSHNPAVKKHLLD